MSNHVHVYRSNIDTPADELECECGKIVPVEEGVRHNDSLKEKSEKGSSNK